MRARWLIAELNSPDRDVRARALTWIVHVIDRDGPASIDRSYLDELCRCCQLVAQLTDEQLQARARALGLPEPATTWADAARTI